MSCRGIAAAVTPGRTSSPPARPAITGRAARRSRRRATASAGRRSSRAATSTRCSRRISRTTATRRGGRTCSWAGTEALDVARPEVSRPDSGAAPDATVLDTAAIAGSIPDTVRDLLLALWGAGHAAYVVGGSLRDAVLGQPAKGWDLATDALPEETLAVFPDAAYENKFGTVGVRRDRDEFEITTFRS